jgi:HEAT repeat protein
MRNALPAVEDPRHRAFPAASTQLPSSPESPMHRQSTLAFLLFVATAVAQAPVDPATELRAKAIDKRLGAITAVAGSDRKDADTLLLPLLRDADWEVQEHTAQAFAKRKTKAALAPLAELAVDGDVARVRHAAVAALVAIDPVDAANRIWKQAKGKSQLPALESLGLVLRQQPPFADAEKVKKLIAEPNAPLREAAAVVWLEGAGDRQQAVRTLLSDPHLAVRCRALDAIAAAPRALDLEPLLTAFGGPGLNDVVSRRLVRALAAVLALGDGDRAGAAIDAMQSAGDSDLALARRARLLPLLCKTTPPVLAPKVAVIAMQPSLRAKDGNARAAAVKALRDIGGDEALQAALAHFPKEREGRVQLQLVETVAALRPPKTPEAVEWLVQIARASFATDVRERAIVHLGKSGVRGAVETLVAATGDREWQLAVCAVVSLGKTDDDGAFAPLQKLLANDDWRLRGAAVIGLMHWSREGVVEPIMGLLEDRHPVVARAAHEALRTLSRRYDATPDPKGWRAWWAGAKGKHDFTDREASLENKKKYGYAVADAEIYQGLDVVVFKSRGDHIEQLLERLKIAHRATEKGQVLPCGMHPEAIFVANCTGELAPTDVEPLDWFVRTGGSLFGSCWALSETIGRLHPGVMQMAVTKDQVLDNVRALPVRADSPLLTGVFPPSVVPIYHLEGSHLIQVMDPERCDVLIDSPDAAERWGCGNLAAWFFSGHGVLFDSANHFDLQGLDQATTLRTDKERQAYAFDHMGMTYETWRNTRSAAYWKSAGKSGDSVPDLSAFRLLTNFVRSKRIGEY